MSMPVIVPSHIERCSAITDMIQSVALQPINRYVLWLIASHAWKSSCRQNWDFLKIACARTAVNRQKYNYFYTYGI